MAFDPIEDFEKPLEHLRKNWRLTMGTVLPRPRPPKFVPKCEYCETVIKKDATRCKNCGAPVTNV